MTLVNNNDDIEEIVICNLAKVEALTDFINTEDIKVKKISSLNDIDLKKQNQLVLIVNGHEVFDKKIEPLVNQINRIILYILKDEFFENNELEISKKFISLGYKFYGEISFRNIAVFVYNISEYKDTPEWLNNENWANPELWEK